MDAHLPPFAVPGLHFLFLGAQLLQDLRGVGLKLVVNQAGGEITDGPPHIRRDEIDELGGFGGEPFDVEVLVQENGGDGRAVEQILHVVVGLGEVVQFTLQLGVDGL